MEEGRTFAETNNLCFFEISAKNSQNLQPAFVQLSETILKKIESHEINPNNEVISWENFVKLAIFAEFGHQKRQPRRKNRANSGQIPDFRRKRRENLDRKPQNRQVLRLNSVFAIKPAIYKENTRVF